MIDAREDDLSTLREVTVVADAAPEAGLGHLSRAGALATALEIRGARVERVAQAVAAVERDGARWRAVEDVAALPGDGPVVVDSYRAGTEALAALARARPLVVFHDEGDVPPGARLVIAFTGDGPDVLSGGRHACLRPAFWGVPRREPAARVRRVVVSAGGGTTADGPVLAAAVRAALPATEVVLVVGPHAVAHAPSGVTVLQAPPDMGAVLAAADLVVTAAGQTMLESLCLGTPTVALAIATNQQAQLDRLAAAGALVATTAGEVGTAAANLADDVAARAALAQAGQREVDGYGALRVAWHVAAL